MPTSWPKGFRLDDGFSEPSKSTFTVSLFNDSFPESKFAVHVELLTAVLLFAAELHGSRELAEFVFELKNSCRSGDSEDTVSLHRDVLFAGFNGDINPPDGVTGELTLSSISSTELTELVERSDAVRCLSESRSGRGGIGGFLLVPVGGDSFNAPASGASTRCFDDDHRRGGTAGVLYKSVSPEGVVSPFDS